MREQVKQVDGEKTQRPSRLKVFKRRRCFRDSHNASLQETMVFSPTLPILVTLLWLTISSSSTFGRSLSAGNTLYDPLDPIIQLNAQNYQSLLFGKSHATVVEFYAHWCGHCQRFAPIYKEFAWDVARWEKVLRVAAVNCADPVNQGICGKYQVSGYPLLKYFGPNVKSADVGTEMEYKERTVAAIREITLEFMSKSSKDKSFSTLFWRRMTPIEASSASDIFHKLPYNGKKPILVVMENERSTLGKEIILDLSMYTNHVTVTRIVNPPGSLIKQLSPNSDVLPILGIIKPHLTLDSLKGIPDQQEATRKLFVDRIKTDLLRDVWVEHEDNLSSSTVGPDVKAEADVSVNLVDLLNSVGYSLSHEALLSSQLNATQVQVLKRYAAVVEKYFPFKDENHRKHVKSISIWLENREATDTSAIKKMMRSAEGYLPQEQPWIGCRGSKVQYRGYPCSLWLVFHTLTVNEYIRGDPTEKPHSALFAIRDYIRHFFSCKYCAQHFAEMSSNLENELRTPKDSVLWLWAAHNKVNKRLAGDATEDPSHPKVQFPPTEMCPNCSKSDSSWDEKAVFDFMTNRFKRDTILKSVL